MFNNKEKILNKAFIELKKLEKKEKNIKLVSKKKQIKVKEEKLAEFIINYDKYQLFQKLRKKYIKITKNNIIIILKKLQISPLKLKIYKNNKLQTIIIIYSHNKYYIEKNFIPEIFNKFQLKEILLNNTFILKKFL